MSFAASFKALARDTCGQLLWLSGLTAPTARLRRSLSILTFHRVLTEQQRRSYSLPGLAVTPDELDAYLRFATQHFRCLPLAAALEVWKKDSPATPPLLAITFDDGQLDNYVNALPVLDQHGVKASFYIPTQVLNDPSPLWHDALAGLIVRLAGPEDAHRSSGVRARDAGAEELLAELDAVDGGGHRSSPHTKVEAALEVTKKGQPPLSLQKDKDGWKPAKGDAKVNGNNVEMLVNTLAVLRTLRWVGATDPAAHGSSHRRAHRHGHQHRVCQGQDLRCLQHHCRCR
ncbi:MAG: hypothetical protein EOO27_39400, partial [Comamonadaceae bacterium]